MTTSKDQTTRIYSSCKKINKWCEISRPQVHGYDINCVAFKINSEKDSTSGVKFPDHVVAGANESILRVFDSPFNFVKVANEYNQDSFIFHKDFTNKDVENNQSKKTEAASMTLGLMNKPILPTKGGKSEMGMTINDFEPDVLTNQQDNDEEIIENEENNLMLTEEYLMAKTRWPERNKLYGHAYEIYCIATTKKGDYIVTAAQSKKKKYSNIFVWTVDSFNPICQMAAHEFTVHQMEFSPNDNYLLCVSRDRQFSVFERNNDPKEPFRLVQLQKQAHKRILWCCSWSHNSRYFATGSREKLNSLKFWDYNEDKNEWTEES